MAEAKRLLKGSRSASGTLAGEYSPTIEFIDVTDKALRSNLRIVIDHFREKFSDTPRKVIRVPGRVNLIGEHIDYCGFPVCPMALDKAIYLAVAPAITSNDFIQISNVDSEKYPFGVIKEYKPKLDISIQKYGWISYIACGVQGVIDKNVELKKFTEPKKMLMAVYGTIPPSAGLSSSSALVCAGFLATCVLNDVVLTKTEMATLCAEAEHYIGTCGGGMDQAIAFNGQKGWAKMVKFNPLRLKDVILPQGAVIMIANTLAEKNKAMSNDFNTRVVECRLASLIVAKVAGIPHWREVKTLSDLQKRLDQASLTEIMILIEKIFHPEPYTQKEICKILDISPAELKDLALTPNTYEVDCFKLKQRATHVYEEADRVYTWRNWCSAGKQLRDLGILMSRSHFSLQYLYECSHPSLDKLVFIFLMSGAYGARLTGAGWGGCTVALVPEDKVTYIMGSLYDLYYKDIYKIREDMSSAVFMVYPGDGAEIFNV